MKMNLPFQDFYLVPQKIKTIEWTVFSQQTNEIVVKTDFDGREYAKLCISWTLYCHILLQTDQSDYVFENATPCIFIMSFAKYGHSAAIFGHDTGRRFFIVRGVMLKNDSV